MEAISGEKTLHSLALQQATGIAPGATDSSAASTVSLRSGTNATNGIDTLLLKTYSDGGILDMVQSVSDALIASYANFVKMLVGTGLKPETPPKQEQSASPQVTSPNIPVGSPLRETNQLFWKPVSAADGNLVVYLPRSLGKAKSVKILSPDRKSVLETGTFGGKTGSKRAQYRFSKTGDKFPDGVIVQIETKRGKIREVIVSQTERLFRH